MRSGESVVRFPRITRQVASPGMNKMPIGHINIYIYVYVCSCKDTPFYTNIYDSYLEFVVLIRITQMTRRRGADIHVGCKVATIMTYEQVFVYEIENGKPYIFF